MTIKRDNLKTEDCTVALFINGVEYKINSSAFRRVLKCAEHSLLQMKSVEGSMFPAVDRQALSIIQMLEANHSGMI